MKVGIYIFSKGNIKSSARSVEHGIHNNKISTRQVQRTTRKKMDLFKNKFGFLILSANKKRSFLKKFTWKRWKLFLENGWLQIKEKYFGKMDGYK